MVDEATSEWRTYRGLLPSDWRGDWLVEAAKTFGNDTAINLHGEFGGSPPEDMILEGSMMLAAAWAAKLLFRGCPQDLINPSCRDASDAYLDMIDRLLADATPGVVH